jgi:hypothetical protein
MTMVAFLTLVTLFLPTDLYTILVLSIAGKSEGIDNDTFDTIVFLAMSGFTDTLRSLMARRISIDLIDTSAAASSSTSTDFTSKISTIGAESGTIAFVSLERYQTTLKYISTIAKPISATSKTHVYPTSFGRLRCRQVHSRCDIVPSLPILMAPTGGYNCTVM